MKSWKGLAAAMLIACAPMAAQAQNAPAAAQQPQRPPPMTGLTKRTGEIVLQDAKVRLKMDKDFYFLDAHDAKRVLTEAWGNPPGAVTDVLGMVFPTRFEPDEPGSWGAVVTFHDIGFVDDKDARTTDYDKLLKDMRAGEADENAELKKEGYPGMHLAGWAEAPKYDAPNHVLIWARDLKVDGADHDTLNYDIRVLGRYGVLSLNAVGGMDDLPAIRAAAAGVRQTVAFDPGARYADVNKSTDKMSELGIAGLIAAGGAAVVAKKAGLLGVILLFGKKFIVIIVAFFGAIAAWFRRLFGLKPKAAPAPALDSSEATPPPSPEPPHNNDIVT